MNLLLELKKNRKYYWYRETIPKYEKRIIIFKRFFHLETQTLLNNFFFNDAKVHSTCLIVLVRIPLKQHIFRFEQSFRFKFTEVVVVNQYLY